MESREQIERIKFYVSKRIETTMIGALAKMEQNFGHLWGHHKPESEPLTAEEETFADMWEFTRNQILNHGNKQIRNLEDDFNKYGGLFKSSYHYSFRVDKNNKK